MKSVVIDKLVRDKIPEVISNEKPTARFDLRYLKGEDLINALFDKVREEIDELEDAAMGGAGMESVALECADVLEALVSIARMKGLSLKYIEGKMEHKRSKNGGFGKGVYLYSYIH